MYGTSRIDPRLATYVPHTHSHLVGVYRVLSSLSDAVVVIHGPIGCHWQASSIESLVDPDLVRSTFSALKEASVVYGGKDKLVKVIEIARRYHRDKHLFIVTTPTTEVIGDDLSDLEDLATIVSGVSLSGDVGEGMEYAFSVLTKFLRCCRDSGSRRSRVNVVGWQWDVVHAHEDMEELLYILKHIVGVDIDSVVPRSIADVERLCCADLNIVFGYGTTLAEAAKKLCGIPYIVVPYPYGLSSTIDFVNRVVDALGIGIDDSRIEELKRYVMNKLRRYREYLLALVDAPAIIVGDPPRLASMSRFIAEELSMSLELTYASYSCKHVFHIPKLSTQYEYVVDYLQKDVVSLGTDTEYLINDKTIVFSYPTTYRISFEPYIGRGLLNIVSDIVNTYLMSSR